MVTIPMKKTKAGLKGKVSRTFYFSWVFRQDLPTSNISALNSREKGREIKVV